MNRTHLVSGGRYPVLRAIAILYLVMAGLTLIGGLIAAGYILASQPWQMTTRIVWSIVALAGTFFAVVGCLAVAEVLKLFMDLEYSARRAAMNSELASGVTTTVQIPVTSGTETAPRRNRFNTMLDEETAEAALIRGH